MSTKVVSTYQVHLALFKQASITQNILNKYTNIQIFVFLRSQTKSRIIHKARCPRALVRIVRQNIHILHISLL